MATSGKPEVLLIDEVFGTGDHSFVAKARSRLAGLIGRSGAVVLASHSAELMKLYATHLLWMHRGKVRMFDTLPVVLDEYRKDMAKVQAGV